MLRRETIQLWHRRQADWRHKMWNEAHLESVSRCEQITPRLSRRFQMLVVACSLEGEWTCPPFVAVQGPCGCRWKRLMLLIRGEERCLAHTQILAAPRMKAALSNSTFINVVMFLTPPRHAAGCGHRLVGGAGSLAFLACVPNGRRGNSSLGD